MSRHRLLLVPAAVALLTSCLPITQVVSAWRDPAYQSRPRKVLVLGVVPNQQYRKRIETYFAERLTARGLAVTPGFALFPGEQPPTRDELLAKLRETGADTLLLARLTDRRVESSYVPVATELQFRSPGTLYNYDSLVSNSLSGGYEVSEEFAFMETRLFDVASEQPIALIASKSSTDLADLSLADDYVDRVTDELRSIGLVP